MSPGIAGCQSRVQNLPCPMRQGGKGRVPPGRLEGELDQETETGSHVSRDANYPHVSRGVSTPMCLGMPALLVLLIGLHFLSKLTAYDC